MSHAAAPYDPVADVYDLWVETAAAAAASLRYYRDLYVRAPDGPVVELGVGTGRIAVEAARAGRPVVGVDVSPEMLERCRARAQAVGVADRLTLVEGDARRVALPRPAALVALPFHTIGHFTTPSDRAALFSNVARQLRPGGRFVFDHFLLGPRAAATPALPDLVAEAGDTLLWAVTRYVAAAESIRIVLYTDRLDERGVLVERRYRRLDFAWIPPDVLRSELEAAGLRVESVHGDFDGRALGRGSSHQVWTARNPTGND